QSRRDLQVMHRGHGHRNRVHLTEELFHARERPAAKLTGDRLGQGRVGINNCHQLRAGTLLLELAIHPRVVPSEGTYTNDCNPDCTFVRQTSIFSELVKSSKG